MKFRRREIKRRTRKLQSPHAAFVIALCDIGIFDVFHALFRRFKM